MRNMITGSPSESNPSAGETFELAQYEQRVPLQTESPNYHFMDNKNYEQIVITEDALGDAKNYLKENR